MARCRYEMRLFLLYLNQTVLLKSNLIIIIDCLNKMENTLILRDTKINSELCSFFTYLTGSSCSGGVVFFLHFIMLTNIWRFPNLHTHTHTHTHTHMHTWNQAVITIIKRKFQQSFHQYQQNEQSSLTLTHWGPLLNLLWLS